MAKKKVRQQPAAEQQPKPTTLKDLLRPDVLQKLKSQADDIKEREAREKEQKRLEAEKKRKEEQKRLDNDFEYLLNNSSNDWRKFK
ncbi:YqkE family protein [Paenibacillus turpanensis]|uniref:YqkE family protein n=1 Tax=Paenibacillus turpanensis TaxID=2689078 RepID=UPI00140D12D9|nr:YqkE family protein [Paenibacillus turpanensis]